MKTPWYKSKVLWVNGLTAIASILTLIIGIPGLETTQVAVYCTATLGVVNVILRFLTTTPIGGNSK